MNCTFEQQEGFQEVFASLNDIDVQIFSVIIEMFRKDKIQDCLGYLSIIENQKHLELYIDKQEKVNDIKNTIQKLTTVIKQIKDHDFNKNNYSSEIYVETRQDLMKKLKDQKYNIEFLKFMVYLTSIDNQFIQCGSNSLYLLVQMKVDLTNQFFVNIKIKNTSLVGANFARCNLSESQLDNVDISGINLNGALLFHCKWRNLRINDLHKLDGHSSDVRTVYFSPDGTTLASGSDDKSICLWDVKTGKQKQKLDGHTNWVQSVCFSPDGTTLASGSADNSIRLWDVKTGLQKFKLDDHQDYVRSVCFSPDGTTLASGGADYSIRLWDVKTGQQQFKLDGHTRYVYSVCFSPDGTTLASCSLDNSIRLWDLQTGKQKSLLKGHSNDVNSVCFSPDGTTLASGSDDCSVRLWDVKTGQEKSRLDDHQHYVRSVCFSPDGTTLASGGADNSIRLWDVKTEQQKSKLDGHCDTINSICFSPDGTILASGSADSSIRLWDVKAGQLNLFQNVLYKDILDKFITAFQNNFFTEGINSNITILLLSQQPIFQAQGAFIFKGEFINQQGEDLLQYFKSKESYILESQLEFSQKLIQN